MLPSVDMVITDGTVAPEETTSDALGDTFTATVPKAAPLARVTVPAAPAIPVSSLRAVQHADKVDLYPGSVV